MIVLSLLLVAAAAYAEGAVAVVLGTVMALGSITGVHVPVHVIPDGGYVERYSSLPLTLAPPPKDIWPLEAMSPEVSVKFWPTVKLLTANNPFTGNGLTTGVYATIRSCTLVL